MCESDIPSVIVLGKAMHQESAYREMTFSEQKCRRLIDYLLSTTESFEVVAVNDTGELCGMMIAAMTQHYFSEDYFIQDYLVYVRPEDRGGTIASRLVAKFLEWAKEQKGAKMLMCGISTEIDTAQAVRLYEHFDFHRAGVLMRRNP